MWHCVGLVKAGVPEKFIASIIRAEKFANEENPQAQNVSGKDMFLENDGFKTHTTPHP
jgi:hypothetical protein